MKHVAGNNVSGRGKTLAIVGPLHPYRGGIAHFAEAATLGLAKRDHQVEGITFSRQYPNLLFPGKTQFDADKTAPPFAIRRSIDSVNPISWLQTAAYLARMQPDAVVFNHWMSFFGPAFGTIARRLRRKGVPSIAIVHNALPHERRPGDVALSRYFFKACQGAVVMSEAVARDLELLGMKGTQVRQIAHPIYDIFGDAIPKAEARRQLGVPADAPVLLFFGFIRRYKGLHVLLESMRAVQKQLPDAHLVIAGEFYEDEDETRTFIVENSLQDRVHLHAEYIPNEAISRYFSAADVVVQPYVSATQSGVAQIAFHFDKPLIVTDVGGLAEIVPDGKAGLVVPPEAPAPLAAAIVRFFQEKLAAALVEGVRNEKKKYSWDRLFEALEHLIGGEG